MFWLIIMSLTLFTSAIKLPRGNFAVTNQDYCKDCGGCKGRSCKGSGSQLLKMAEANVEVLYDAKARLGEGPCYDHVTGELIFVDILAQTVNFFNLETKQNRYHSCILLE